jgi:hypothetical protein
VPLKQRREKEWLSSHAPSGARPSDRQNLQDYQSCYFLNTTSNFKLNLTVLKLQNKNQASEFLEQST